jgi:hypothetical protein
VQSEKKEKPQGPQAPGIQAGAPSSLDIPEKFLDDISDGDYLLESLRDFRPPTAENRNEMTNIFDGKGRIPEKLQIIGGATDIRGQKMNDESLDDLNFFDKPVEEFVEKNDKGFKKAIQKEPLKRVDSDKDEDSASNSNSFAKKPAKSEFFNPVA